MKEKPWWIAPAMNGRMWEHPATRTSLEKLRTWGVRILDPVEGAHACGESGPGRLLEPEQIATEVLNALSKR
jgi:phosphopantothenoylcysteine decarboxylase/phosphopantothenate--cysteine ligase